MLLIDLHLRLYVRLEVPDLAIKLQQQLAVGLHLGRVEGRLDGIVGNLEQSRIRKPLRAGEFEDPVIDRGLNDVDHPDSIRFGIHVDAHAAELSGGLDCRRGLVHLLLRERLAEFLYELRRKLFGIDIDTPGHLDA